MLITTILILTIFVLLMDGYYVTNDIAKVSEKAQAHSIECQRAPSHKVLQCLSARSDIMDITTAKELLALHTAAAISSSDIKQISVLCQPIATPTIPYSWHEWCIW
jgi:hypothetical protein